MAHSKICAYFKETMKTKSPKFMLAIVYPKDEKSQSECKRFIFAYSQSELNELLGKAWKPRATAQLFELSCIKERQLKATEKAGLWA